MEPNPDYIDRFANGQAGTADLRLTDIKFRPIQQPQTGNPPPGMPTAPLLSGSDQLSGYYSDSSRRNFIPYDQPQPQTGGDIQYAGGTPGFYGRGGQGYGNPFGGGFDGGYNSPYISPSMMGGLASLFGGMQGGGFQGMFNPQSQAEAQMRAYQQNQQSRMIPLDQPDSNSYSLTRSYMDPVSGKHIV